MLCCSRFLFFPRILQFLDIFRQYCGFWLKTIRNVHVFRVFALDFVLPHLSLQRCHSVFSEAKTSKKYYFSMESWRFYQWCVFPTSIFVKSAWVSLGKGSLIIFYYLRSPNRKQNFLEQRKENYLLMTKIFVEIALSKNLWCNGPVVNLLYVSRVLGSVW